MAGRVVGSAQATRRVAPTLITSIAVSELDAFALIFYHFLKNENTIARYLRRTSPIHL